MNVAVLGIAAALLLAGAGKKKDRPVSDLADERKPFGGKKKSSGGSSKPSGGSSKPSGGSSKPSDADALAAAKLAAKQAEAEARAKLDAMQRKQQAERDDAASRKALADAKTERERKAVIDAARARKQRERLAAELAARDKAERERKAAEDARRKPEPSNVQTPPEGYDRAKAANSAKDVARHLSTKGIAGYSRPVLRAWQKLAGIPQDGIYGHGSHAALAYYNGNAPKAFFNQGEKVYPWATH